jgi:N-acetyl-anhydromuramyl-L-alanine amidase AmpD
VKAATVSQWDIARFGQVSYHYVIELDGNTVATLPETTKGAHVGGANTGNIGVCYIGGVDKDGKPKDTRTEAQKVALAKIIREYKARFPKIIVLGHRDWPNVKKACPSFSVTPWIKAGFPTKETVS